MDADLDTLATALYVTSDDFLADNPQHRPWRPRVGLAPRLSDAELVTLVVLQALLGFTSEARFLRYAKASLRGMFPYLPTQSGYNKRIRAATGMLRAVIAYLVACTSSSSDDVWVVDSAPVECGRSRETAQRSDLAGWAEYGYCASHSRFFWGLRLHLVCTLSGLPVAFALAGAKADERDVLLAIFEADPNLVAARPQAEVDGGQELADVALLPSDLPVFEEPTSESFCTAGRTRPDIVVLASCGSERRRTPMVALHTAIAIVLAIGLIIRFKVDPVISLLLASLYLGLASGVGFAGTIEAIAAGFGEIMAEVGLLIGFGVLIGAFLHSAGAFHRLLDVLVRMVGATRLPYALSILHSTILPSIYVDVQVVLASPVARSAAPYISRNGLPLMASSLGAGIFAGYVFVIPGLAAISIAGLLGVPLGTWLLFGIVIGPLTAIITSLIMRLILRGGLWKPESDEDVDEAMIEQEAHEIAAAAADADADADAEAGRSLPLVVLLLPILVPLILIAFGAFAELLDFSTSFIAFLGNANLALFVGLVGAYLLFRATVGLNRTRDTMDEGFHTTGEILLITGVGGSLGAVIGETDLDSVLAGLFQAEAGTPVVVSILLSWFIAALLHLAIGSVSVAAITAAGIIAPILGSISVAPVVIGLAIASGAMFALQVNSNFFWMFKALLGLSTKGSLKTLTGATSIAAVVSLPMVIVASLVAGP